jgi:hypothetical protein
LALHLHFDLPYLLSPQATILRRLAHTIVQNGLEDRMEEAEKSIELCFKVNYVLAFHLSELRSENRISNFTSLSTQLHPTFSARLIQIAIMLSPKKRVSAGAIQKGELAISSPQQQTKSI